MDDTAKRLAAALAELAARPTWAQVEEAYHEAWTTNHRSPYQGQHDVESDWIDSESRRERDEATKGTP